MLPPRTTNWFAAVPAEKPKAKNSWDALIPSRKKEILRYFAALKSPEAKARNLRRAIPVLSVCGVDPRSADPRSALEVPDRWAIRHKTCGKSL
jgi:hypothetical protein